MAKSNQIKSSELIQENIFDNTIKSAEELNATLNDLKKNFIEVSKESVKYAQSNKTPKNAQELKAVNDAIDKGTKARISAIKVAKIQKQLELEEEKLRQAKLKTEKQLRDAETKANREKEKALKQQQKEIDNLAKQNSAYNKASKTLNELRQRYKDMAFEGKGATIEAVNLLREINNLDTNLKAVDASVGQFNRSVGNYENAIEGALQKTGLFGGIIQKVTDFVETFESIVAIKTSILEADTIATETNTVVTEANAVAENVNTVAHEKNIVALEAETIATNELSLAKRALNAITSPIGAILALITAIGGLIAYLATVNQALKDFFSTLGAGINDVVGKGAEFSKLLELQIKFRKEINGMLEDLQKLRDAEGDLQFDYEDQTRTLEFRTKALQDFNKARVDAALKEKEISTRELEIAKQQLKAEESRYGVGKGKANQEFYDQLSEAQRKFYDSNDKYLDLITQIIPKSEREFLEQTIINQIELIRSKKLGADTQVEILKKQVDDEKTILENRNKAFIELTQAQIKAQEEEIQLLQKFGLTRKEIDDLIAQKDAVLLEQQLTQLHNDKLSIGQKEELAKVIVEIQKAEFDRGQQQQKLDEQAIKNQERLLELTVQIDNVKLKTEIQQNQRELELLNKRVEKQKQLSLTNPFNTTYYKTTLTTIDKVISKEIELTVKEKEEINKRYNAQIEAIRKQVKEKTKEKEIGQKEIELLNKQRIQELDKLNTAEINLALSKEKFLKDLRKQQTIETIEEFNKVTQAFSQQLQQRRDLQQQEQQDSLNRTQRNIETQQKLAERGLNNTLAFEQQIQAKKELEAKKLREKQAREQQVLQLTSAYWSAFNAELKKEGSDPANASAKALKDVFLAQAISKTVVQFAKDGNERVAPINGYGGQIGVDDIPFMLTRDEGVVTRDANLGNPGVVKALNGGYFDKMFMPRIEISDINSRVYESTANNMYQSILVQQNNELLTKIDKLIKKPVQSVNVDSFGNLIETIRTEAKQTIITHKPRKKL